MYKETKLCYQQHPALPKTMPTDAVDFCECVKTQNIGVGHEKNHEVTSKRMYVLDHCLCPYQRAVHLHRSGIKNYPHTYTHFCCGQGTLQMSDLLIEHLAELVCYFGT